VAADQSPEELARIESELFARLTAARERGKRANATADEIQSYFDAVQAFYNFMQKNIPSDPSKHKWQTTHNTRAGLRVRVHGHRLDHQIDDREVAVGFDRRVVSVAHPSPS
jgi:hypothetical protein